jgi:hypothetical protein
MNELLDKFRAIEAELNFPHPLHPTTAARYRDLLDEREQIQQQIEDALDDADPEPMSDLPV